MELKRLPIDLLRRGIFQPRRLFDQQRLLELAESIKSQGLIEPIVVRRRVGDNGYEIIAGERRWRAAMLAGIEELPCLVKRYCDSQAAAVSIIENIQRENLNFLEEAQAYQRLMDDFSYTQERIAQLIGKSRSHIANTLRLLSLSPSVQKALELQQLSFGHARALVGLDLFLQTELAKQSIAQQWSVRTLEKKVQRSKRNRPVASPTLHHCDYQRLTQRLSEYLGTPVDIENNSTSGGCLRIKYFDNDTLSGILERMGLLESEDYSNA